MGVGPFGAPYALRKAHAVPPQTIQNRPGFGGWISSFVLLEGATQSEAKAAFLVSIFWAAVTIGRCVSPCACILVFVCTMHLDHGISLPSPTTSTYTRRAVAVGQAMVVGPSWSLRLQLSISLGGALTFLALGASSFQGAAIAAAVFGCVVMYNAPT